MDETWENLIAVVEAGNEINHLAILMPDQRTTDLLYAAHRGSLDAAEALHKALLPEWWVQHLGRNLAGWGCRIERQGCSLPESTLLPRYKTPARAWLLAILRAYASQVE